MKNYFKDLWQIDQSDIDLILNYAGKILLAIIILWLGMKLVKKLHKSTEHIMIKSNISDNVRPFLLNITDITFKAIIIFIALSVLGANLSGLVALVAAIGFAVGMSLQGSLGNFASGLLILTLKPYKVGDWIQLNEKFGRVEEIMIFNTKIVTTGQKVLIIPNAKLTDDIVVNYSEKGVIRLEIEVHIPYEENWSKIKQILNQSLKQIPEIFEDPAPEIGIADFDSHSLLILVRPYINPDNYWAVTFKIHEVIKSNLHQHKVSVPYSEGIEFGKYGA